jgi:hypothetical protein
VAKLAELLKSAPPGLTVLPIEADGLTGYFALADESDYVKKLRAQGDDVLLAHLEDVIGSLTGRPASKLAARSQPSPAETRLRVLAAARIGLNGGGGARIW